MLLTSIRVFLYFSFLSFSPDIPLISFLSSPLLSSYLSYFHQLSIILRHPPLPSDSFLASLPLSFPNLIQHTGSAADLICETLKKANEFVHKRRINPRAKPIKPFKINLPENYM